MRGPTCDCCGRLLVIACRFWGLLTALGLWGIGVEAVFYHHKLGYYLLPLAVLISFLETVFLLYYFVEIIASPSGVCERVWEGVLWLDDWRKGVLYFLLAGGCCATPNTVPLAIVCGAFLAFTALLYCLKTIKTRKERSVDRFTSKSTYGRFEQDELPVDEDLEDIITNPTSNMSVMSVADQIEILEV